MFLSLKQIQSIMGYSHYQSASRLKRRALVWLGLPKAKGITREQLIRYLEGK